MLLLSALHAGPSHLLRIDHVTYILLHKHGIQGIILLRILEETGIRQPTRLDGTKQLHFAGLRPQLILVVEFGLLVPATEEQRHRPYPVPQGFLVLSLLDVCLREKTAACKLRKKLDKGWFP